MSGGFLPDVYLPSDQKTLQAQLLSDAKATDDSVRSCAALDQATRASWGLFYVQVAQFASQDPGSIFFGSKIDRAQTLQIGLYQWQQKLAKVCALTLPQVDPTKTPSGGQTPPSPTLSTFENIVRWLAIGVIAGGGAYVVGKGLSLIPTKKTAK